MTQQKTILIVDDDEPLRLSLSLILQKENYRVETAADAEKALDCLQQHECDLMFLDLNLPGMSGIDLLVEVHKRLPYTSVLILTAYAALESAIQAIRLGARDYLVKPVEPVEIVTRVAEILAEGEQPARKQGIFEVDLQARHVMMNGNYVPVTGVNFDYLSTLLRHAPKAVPYKTLVKESQGYDVAVAEARDLARWRIHELRKLVEANPERPQYILTVRGTGYRLVI